MVKIEGEPKVFKAEVTSPRENGKLFTLAELAEKTGYHPVYLRRLMIAGKIKGSKAKFGNFPEVWVTTEEAIKEYELNRDRRGRPKGGKK